MVFQFVNWVLKEEKYGESFNHSEEKVLQVMNEYCRGLCGCGWKIKFVIPSLSQRCSAVGTIGKAKWWPVYPESLHHCWWLSHDFWWTKLTWRCVDPMLTFRGLFYGSNGCLGWGWGKPAYQMLSCLFFCLGEKKREQVWKKGRTAMKNGTYTETMRQSGDN